MVLVEFAESFRVVTSVGVGDRVLGVAFAVSLLATLFRRFRGEGFPTASEHHPVAYSCGRMSDLAWKPCNYRALPTEY